MLRCEAMHFSCANAAVLDGKGLGAGFLVDGSNLVA